MLVQVRPRPPGRKTLAPKTWLGSTMAVHVLINLVQAFKRREEEVRKWAGAVLRCDATRTWPIRVENQVHHGL